MILLAHWRLMNQPVSASQLSRLFQELTHAHNMGRIVWEDGHPMWRGETDIEAILGSLVGGPSRGRQRGDNGQEK